MQMLTGEGPCDVRWGVQEGCIPYIDDIAKLGSDGADAAVQLGKIVTANRSLEGSVNAHARVALEKVAQEGDIEGRIKELVNLIPKSDLYEKQTLAEEAAAYASFPQYTKSVNNTFAPLLSDAETFESALTAIAGGGERSKDMVSKILNAVPKYERSNFGRLRGDAIAHELEKIVGSAAIGEIRTGHGWKCHHWL